MLKHIHIRMLAMGMLNGSSCIRRAVLLLVLSLLGTIGFAQTDTDFWFSVPEINRYHTSGNDARPSNNGSPVFFRITAGAIASTVTIAMPANSAFNKGKDSTFTVPAFKTVTIDLNKAKFLGDPWGADPGVSDAASIENRLKWTTSNLTAAKPFANRNNKGVHITASAPITIYYEISALANMDLLTLKGRNALGKEFFIPFQNSYNTALNRYPFKYRPYSSFDIVATEDNTHIRVTPTSDVFVHPIGVLKKNTAFDMWLSKGETAIFAPYDPDPSNRSIYKTNDHKENRLIGSKVEVVEGGDIAIITRDDMVEAPSGNVDFAGDQLVPTKLIGKDYAVVSGQLKNDEEYAYVIATQNATTISVNGGAPLPVLNAGGFSTIQIPSTDAITTIKADKPIYVYHLSGFGDGRQTQFGGALIPTISTCTGSTRVAFNRTKEYPYDFYLNLLVRDGAESSFVLTDEKGANVTNLLPALNNARGYTSVGATFPYSNWKYLRLNANSLAANKAYTLSNTKDIFHVGLLNGSPSQDAFYGYFSDFNELKIGANVAGIDAGQIKICYGSPIQVYASGGTKYEWTPEVYFTKNADTKNPIIVNDIYNPIINENGKLTGTLKVNVTVSGACNMVETKSIDIEIFPATKADFSVDNITGCSPLTVNFTNTSLNAANLKWDFGDGTISSSNKFTPPGLVEQLSHVYVNTTNVPITFTVQLEVENESGCGYLTEKKITVYPSVEAKLKRIDPTTISYCSPRSVTFENTSPATALPPADITYIWDYGDGGSIKTDDKAVAHNFSVLNMDKKRYDVSLTMINKFGCKSVDKDTIDVYGKVAAFFALDKNSGCPNPNFNAVLTDGSTGAIAKRTWNWNGFTNTLKTANTYDIATSSTSATTTIHTITLNVEGAGGCKDTFKQDITLYPYVNAQFSIDNAELCDGKALNIVKSPSPGATDFIWDFGDGSTSSATTATVTHLYNNATYAPVKYNVKLTAKSTEGGCQSTSAATPVTVYSRIDPNFNIVGLGGCAPFMATIVNTSKGNKDNTYSWDFDSDANFELMNEKFVAEYQHQFTNTSAVLAGYKVTLKAVNEGGCSKSTSGMALVYPKPTSGFTVDNSPDLCNPLPVKLTATTNVPEYSYTWSFGDGSTGSQPTVSHTYNNFDFTKDATFEAALSVSSIYGCLDIAKKSITVRPLLKAAFTMEQLSLCTPFEVRITPRSLGATSYSWNYGDGRTNPGVTSSTPFIITYDNLTAAAATYNIGMVATNASGACKSTAPSVEVVVNPRVVANGSFTFDDEKKKCSGEVTFKNTSTGGTSYTWDFGDGQSASTPTATDIKHTYENRTSSTKRFTAKLAVVNGNECTVTKTFDVDVVPRVESAFTYTVMEKCTPMKIALVNTSLNGTEFNWDYGHTLVKADQLTSTTPFEKIIDNEDPSNIKVYKITLKTVDKGTGCSAESNKELTVYPKIIPAITSTIVDNCKGGVTFKNATTGATSYTWSFGDQTSSFSTDKRDDISHTYLNRSATSKIFNAFMVASNAIGCSDTTKKDVTIVPRVESAFTLEELDGCTPVKVKLTNTSLNGQQFTWDYGHTIGGVAQLDVKTDKQPLERLIDNESDNDIKTYPIKLTVVDKNTLCSDSHTINFDVHPKLRPSFTADKLSGCSDLPVIFTNTSTGGVMSFDWDFKDGQSSKTGAVSETVAHTFTNRQAATQNYSVAMLATNSKGCRVEASKTIGVYPKVEAAFAFVQTSKCTPFPIDITNGSLNGTEYQWDFGHTFNGNRRDTVSKSKAGFRTYIYNDNSANALTYTLSLTARDATTGCSHTVTKAIDAQPEVKSLFGLSVDRGCNPLTVSLTNNATGSTSYTWDFGNNTSSTSPTPATMTFVNTDTVKVKPYTITMTAKNGDGCINKSTKRVDVYPTVMADFNIDKINGCTPLSVKVFNAYTSSAYRYEWALGSAGSNVDQQIPPLNFINSTADHSVQSENIKLKVYYKGDANCFKEVERKIDVYPGTLSDFSMDVTEACNPLVVSFTNSSKSFNSSTSYRWSFDNLGNSGEANPKYTFGNLSHTLSKTYTVKLKSISMHGCNDSITKTVVVRPIPKAQMAITSATGCAPFDIQVQNLSVGATPKYTFWMDNDRANSVVKTMSTPVSFSIDNMDAVTKTTEVWLKAVSDFGCKDSVSQKVFTYPHITSAFTFAPAEAGCSPLSVSFTNTSQRASVYTWDFNDGATASIASPNHVFNNSQEADKTFNVKLKVKSEFGCEHESSKNFTVYSTPIAYFTIDPPIRTYPDASFIFTNKTAPKVNSWTYEWTYGDGGKYVGVDPPVYTYKTWGDLNDDYKYHVTLKVSNAKCHDETKQFLYLKPAIPISTFASNISSSCVPLEAQFSHQAKFYKTIEWDFGDGTKSVENNPFHVYTTPGKYNVQLVVKGDGGTSFSLKTLDVFPNPTASFKLAPAEAMLPEAKVQFYNTSSNGTLFRWEFGDIAGLSSEKNPSYTYTKLGSYDVKLQVTSENGCVDDTLIKSAVRVVGQGLLKFPNAFIPSSFGGNGGAYELPDYKNEVFHPVSEGVVTYKLIVYNRWGELLFSSNDLTVGWDGYSKGKLCEQGVYVYRATGKYTNGKSFDIKGDLTLLR